MLIPIHTSKCCVFSVIIILYIGVRNRVRERERKRERERERESSVLQQMQTIPKSVQQQ